MRTQIPRARLTGFFVAALAALGLFLYLNSTFGGPTLIPSASARYELHASFPDSQNLVTNSLVMYRGFEVGLVDNVTIVDARADVSFHLFPAYAPVPVGTIAQVDHRTFLQEAFVNLYPGPVGGPTLRSGAALRSIPTVEPDDALQVFDPRTRRLLDQGTQALARGLVAPNAGQEVNGTIAGLDGVLVDIHRLVSVLGSQTTELTSLVSGSATVLNAVASEQAQLRELIAGGRVTAQTFAAEHGALASGLDRLDALLASAQRVLPRLRPLMLGAPPVLAHLMSTASVLRPALVALKPAIAATERTSTTIAASSRAAVPALERARAAERPLRPLAVRIHPLVENLVPVLQWVVSRIRGFEAFIANDAASMTHGDSIGPWLQGFLQVTPAAVTGGDAGCSAETGLCVNPYPQPGDASDPQPYVRGDFPHLVPYLPK